jgi:transcriptional regulator with XRE-family HTH domain
MSSAALARAAGLSPAMLSLLERGEREPSLATVRSVASALNVPPGLLLLAVISPEDLESTLGHQLAKDALFEVDSYLSTTWAGTSHEE